MKGGRIGDALVLAAVIAIVAVAAFYAFCILTGSL